MRIAQVAPLRAAVPPAGYGGTERVISELTDGLVQLGHEVTLFASGDSRTTARLASFVPKALGFDPEVEIAAVHLALLTEVYRHAGQFDVIHSHLEYMTLPFVAHTCTPTVLTLHGRLDVPEIACVMQAYPNANYVSISDSQREPLPCVNWAATVYHGVGVHDFDFFPECGHYLVFVGRIAAEKCPHRAIEIAKRAGVPLKIAAKVDPKDRAYFKQKVEPLLDDPLIEFLGPLNEKRKRELMGRALALLLPIDWPEPFGVVFIESLACGTPVLTRARGAAPEILRDGVTGYVCETDEEMAEAVHELLAIARAGCREYVEDRFDTMRMARDYVTLYERLRRGDAPTR